MALLLREVRFREGDRTVLFSVWTDLQSDNDPRLIRLRRAVNDFSDGGFRNFALICRDHIGNDMVYVPETNPDEGTIGAIVFADCGFFSVTRNFQNVHELDILLHITYSLE